MSIPFPALVAVTVYVVAAERTVGVPLIVPSSGLKLKPVGRIGDIVKAVAPKAGATVATASLNNESTVSTTVSSS